MRCYDYHPGEGPQSFRDALGRPVLCKGGGGGSQAFYKNMDKLYGEQARAAEFMLDQSMPYLPDNTARTDKMVQDAFDGTLGNTLKNEALANANASIGTSNNDALRNLASFGAIGDPSGGRAADIINKNAFNSAAMRAGAANTATQYAEEQKWNRNAGQFGQLTGMSDGAMQGLSSSASGLGNLASQANQNAQANAAGYGQFGATLGAALMKADGGYINEPKLAGGGNVWDAYKKNNPIKSSGTAGGGGMSPIASIATGMAPTLAAEGLKQAGIGDIVKSGLGSIGAIPASQAGIAAADAAATGLGTAAAEAATAAATTAAAETAAAGTVAATNAWNPIGWAAALYGLSEMFSEGGSVGCDGRKDFRPGGRVTGPGTETSDSIPAWLSKNEYVLNAEAVKMIGKQKLDKLNDKGLERRQEKQQQVEFDPNNYGLELALANGGFLGVALGAGANEYNRQQELAANRDYRNKMLAIQQSSADRQADMYKRETAREDRTDAANARASQYLSDANAISSFDTGHMTPEERKNAAAAYRDAGYTPDALRQKAAAELGGLDLLKGMNVSNALNQQEQARRQTAVGNSLAQGDMSGAFSNAGGDWTSNQGGLELLKTRKTPSGEMLQIGRDGKVVTEVPKNMSGDYLQSVLTGNFGAYNQAQRNYENMLRDNARADKQLGISAGQLGLAQQRYKDEQEREKQKREIEQEIVGLRRRLAATPASDDATRAAIQQQINDLSGYRPTAQGIRIAEDENGKNVVVFGDGTVGEINQLPRRGVSQPVGTVKSPVKVISKADVDALPSGTRFVGPNGVEYIKR